MCCTVYTLKQDPSQILCILLDAQVLISINSFMCY